RAHWRHHRRHLRRVHRRLDSARARDLVSVWRAAGHDLRRVHRRGGATLRAATHTSRHLTTELSPPPYAAVRTFHDPPAFPRGFRCASRNCGLKPTAKDLALFVSDADAAAAAVFTRNHFPGAPVLLGRETIRGGQLRAIVVNSKVSNVATGERGLENARRMARAAAVEVGTIPERVLVSSTGVIG